MNEIEVLAKLKMMFESILDIQENFDIMKKNSKIIAELSSMYEQVYKTISKERGLLMIQVGDKEYRISSFICCDYESINGDYFTCGDLNYYWYLDPNSIVYPQSRSRKMNERIR